MLAHLLACAVQMADGHLLKEVRDELLGCLRETYRAGFPVLLEDAACSTDAARRSKAMARIRELNKLAGFPMKVRLAPVDAEKFPVELPEIVASLGSEDPQQRLSAVRLLRRFLCVGELSCALLTLIRVCVSQHSSQQNRGSAIRRSSGGRMLAQDHRFCPRWRQRGGAVRSGLDPRKL